MQAHKRPSNRDHLPHSRTIHRALQSASEPQTRPHDYLDLASLQAVVRHRLQPQHIIRSPRSFTVMAEDGAVHGEARDRFCGRNGMWHEGVSSIANGVVIHNVLTRRSRMRSGGSFPLWLSIRLKRMLWDIGEIWLSHGVARWAAQCPRV